MFFLTKDSLLCWSALSMYPPITYYVFPDEGLPPLLVSTLHVPAPLLHLQPTVLVSRPELLEPLPPLCLLLLSEALGSGGLGAEEDASEWC